jgi:DNA polymerase I-like protein with 3'-5' exonuclease and polymerase domains
MRGFIIAPPGRIACYVDWRTQEIGVAAGGSGDRGLVEAYLSGDVYHTLAYKTGITKDPDRIRWKKENPDQRERMKKLQLAINYGMSVMSLARGLERHPVVATRLFEDYKRTYPRFFEWREAEVHRALCDRFIESPLGWPLHISHSPNKRTLYNFPMQSGGADMLRLASVRLCEAGIVPTMLIHDAVLLEVDNVEQVEHAREIMRQAGRDVCNGLTIDADVDQWVTLEPKLLPPGTKSKPRFADKRDVAQEMWKTIMDTLESLGVFRERIAS